MLIGFTWIIYICLKMDVSNKDYSLMVKHVKNLPEGEMILRKDAVSEIREFQLDIRHYNQSLIIPALLMLIGGIINGMNRKKSEPDVSANLDTAVAESK